MISIITTVKNGSKYILETLESIKAQTFKEYEHIVVDDGSTDNTLQILEGFQKQNPDYKLLIYQPGSLGRGKALNFAVSKANFDWVAIIDADDIWHPKKLEIQYYIICNQKIDVLATEAALFNKNNEIVFSKNIQKIEVVFYKFSDLLRSNKLSHSSVLIRKELCVYDENRTSQFDYELWLRLAEQRKVLAKITDIFNYHRIHDNQSFEGKMKKAYRWRSFKLKANKSLENNNFNALFYNVFKFIFDLITPRNIRIKIREILHK